MLAIICHCTGRVVQRGLEPSTRQLLFFFISAGTFHGAIALGSVYDYSFWDDSWNAQLSANATGLANNVTAIHTPLLCVFQAFVVYVSSWGICFWWAAHGSFFDHAVHGLSSKQDLARMEWLWILIAFVLPVLLGTVMALQGRFQAAPPMMYCWIESSWFQIVFFYAAVLLITLVVSLYYLPRSILYLYRLSVLPYHGRLHNLAWRDVFMHAFFSVSFVTVLSARLHQKRTGNMAFSETMELFLSAVVNSTGLVFSSIYLFFEAAVPCGSSTDLHADNQLPDSPSGLRDMGALSHNTSALLHGDSKEYRTDGPGPSPGR